MDEAGGARVIDLGRPLSDDCHVTAVAPDSPDGLEVLRHSSAHLMAQAVKRLFPGREITIGPVIDNGFYYDFKRAQGSPPRIWNASKRRCARSSRRTSRCAARRCRATAAVRDVSRAWAKHYKVEIIAGIPEDVVSLYRQGEFVDLCRGPHVPSTGRIKAFKLTSVAGAYWRGD